MIAINSQYIELLALAKLYLLQEYGPQERIFANFDVYTDFKQQLLKQKALSATSPTLTLPKTEEPRQESLPAYTPPPIKQIVPTKEIISPTSASIESVKTHAKETISKQPKLEEKPIKAEKSPLFFQLEPFENLAPADFSDFHAILKEKFPNQPIVDEIPCDSHARKANEPDIIILKFHETDETLNFLNKLSAAIESLQFNSTLLSAPELEQTNKWEEILQSPKLKLILANKEAIQTLPKLMKHYNEAKPVLGKISLIPLSDHSAYLNDRSLKSTLWKAIKEQLSQHSVVL